MGVRPTLDPALEYNALPVPLRDDGTSAPKVLLAPPPSVVLFNDDIGPGLVGAAKQLVNESVVADFGRGVVTSLTIASRLNTSSSAGIS